MRILLPAFLFAATTGFSMPALAAREGAPAPSLEVTDASGQVVRVPAENRPVVLFFFERGASEEVREIAAEISPRFPGAMIVNVIDLRGVPELLEGVARERVEAAIDDAVRAERKAWREAGLEPPPDARRRIHLVPDFEGKILRAYGAGEGEVHVVVVDAKGRVAADFDEAPAPEKVAAVLEELPSTD